MVAHTLSEAEFYQWMNESLAKLESQLKTVINEFRSFRTTWEAQSPTLPPPVSATAPPVPPCSISTPSKPAPSIPTPKPSPPPSVPKINPVLCQLSSNYSHSYSVVVSADSGNTEVQKNPTISTPQSLASLVKSTECIKYLGSKHIASNLEKTSCLASFKRSPFTVFQVNYMHNGLPTFACIDMVKFSIVNLVYFTLELKPIATRAGLTREWRPPWPFIKNALNAAGRTEWRLVHR
ncbi:hypothetical protein HanIR_Chr13g0665811 [Helianthus annuus]|nr:hypothetical protein HanIR_Chr13g0665811 [Helianthus annuus]